MFFSHDHWSWNTVDREVVRAYREALRPGGRSAEDDANARFEERLGQGEFDEMPEWQVVDDLGQGRLEPFDWPQEFDGSECALIEGGLPPRHSDERVVGEYDDAVLRVWDLWEDAVFGKSVKPLMLLLRFEAPRPDRWRVAASFSSFRGSEAVRWADRIVLGRLLGRPDHQLLGPTRSADEDPT